LARRHVARRIELDQKRAAIDFSMGGYGAIKVAFRHLVATTTAHGFP
jgi:S-formylglutathione hydrolase FrmB